jgi:hypothetical protein
MRQDQYERLQALSEKLTDVLIEEADPELWPGSTIPVDKQDKAIRGDRYWFKRNAVATCALVIRVGTLVGVVQRNSQAGIGAATVQESEDEMDSDIAIAEKEGKALLDRMTKAQNKKKFDGRLHGKQKA